MEVGTHTVLLVQEEETSDRGNQGSGRYPGLGLEFGLTSEFGMLVQRLHAAGGR